MENEGTVINSVIEELSKINKAADSYAVSMEEAKKKLEKDYRNQREDFDLQMHDEAEDRLAKLKEQLTAENNAKIEKLRSDSQEYTEKLEKAFDEKHSEWAEEIAKRIVAER